MKLPKLWRRNVAGKLIGAFHVTIKGTRINLGTQDANAALARRKLAMAGRRKFKDDIEGAAEATIAALDGTASAQTPAVVEAQPATEATAHPPSAPAPAVPLPLPPPGAAVPGDFDAAPTPAPTPAQGQQAPSDWAAAANAAADAVPDDASDTPAAAPPSPKVKFGDLPFLKGAFVTASKVAVTIQLALQAWAARLIGDYEMGRVGPAAEVVTPEQFAAEASKGEAWTSSDPREPGRAIYEEVLKRVCPDDLDVPDWVLAPVITAMFTLPVQIAGGKKIDHSKDPPKTEETPPDEARAAA